MPALIPEPGYHDCPWPVDPACLGDTWDSLDPEVQTRATALASSTLRRLTGYRVGGCPITVRPCRVSCTTTYGYPFYWTVFGHGFVPNLNTEGMWVNSCGCTTLDCHCGPLCEVTLPGPVGEVYTVRVDGDVVAPTDYRLYGNSLMWTGIGDCPWPMCQDLSLPDTEVGTFSITYLNAYPVDLLGAYAAGVLAYEYAQACVGNSCRLPSNVTAVSRQGVSFEVATGAFPDGFTGIREVDAYIALWNPNAIRQSPIVWTPDQRTPRVVR